MGGLEGVAVAFKSGLRVGFLGVNGTFRCQVVGGRVCASGLYSRAQVGVCRRGCVSTYLGLMIMTIAFLSGFLGFIPCDIPFGQRPRRG